MKILFPIGSFYPTTYGGPGTILYWHGVYLKKHHITPTFVTTTLGITSEVTTNSFLDLPCGNVYYGRGGVLNLRLLQVMLSEVKKVDIIHLTSLFSPISIICFLYARLFYPKTKIVWSVRGELNDNALAISQKKKTLFLKLYQKLAKQVVFASTSPKESDEITHVFQNKIIEIPNVMPSSEQLKRTTTNKRFLFLGRIHPIKNIDGLINGFCSSIASKQEDVFLDIAGDYDERDIDYLESLKALVVTYGMEHKISFLGHVAGSAKEVLLVNAYFLVLPSHSENFGNVVIEALNQGTPVIASKQTPWQILREFSCGFWVDNTPEMLQEAFDDALKLNATSYQSYRNQALKLNKEVFAIDTRIEDWANTYNTLLK